MAALSVVAALSVAVGEARACDPAQVPVSEALPAEGAVVPPGVQLALFYQGAASFREGVALLDADGAEVAVEVVHQAQASLADFGGMFFVVPEEPLSQGDYTLRVDYGEQLSEEAFERHFSVDPALGVEAPPGAVSFTWYRERFDELVGSSCGMGDERHTLRLEPLEVMPASYVVRLKTADAEKVRVLHPSEDLSNWGATLTAGEVRCVEVVATDVTGAEGDAVEVCVPDKCVAHQGETLGVQVDWSLVEGCEQEEPSEGDPNDADVEGEGTSSEDEPACSAAGSTGSPGLVLVALGLVAALRGRRGRGEKG
ncbi:hypothetical protein DL240_04070 [Lujinxingia litoralis]|uniref:Macroglobulin domain-containing protein n=1 Tax=Lujinxingia litoralis TaxID=2211119 RepID=A0A328CA97_9DELT|nr:hypothetical protein DL240_04070 [Lujinxingia litoralis]